MAERRPLVEGLKQRTEQERKLESEFVYRDRANGPSPAVSVEAPSAAPGASAKSAEVGRAPLSTRVRADLAEALKRASLQRQLAKEHPSSVQEILEEALEPWLRQHGYLG